MQKMVKNYNSWTLLINAFTIFKDYKNSFEIQICQLFNQNQIDF